MPLYLQKNFEDSKKHSNPSRGLPAQLGSRIASSVFSLLRACSVFVSFIPLLLSCSVFIRSASLPLSASLFWLCFLTERTRSWKGSRVRSSKWADPAASRNEDHREIPTPAERPRRRLPPGAEPAPAPRSAAPGGQDPSPDPPPEGPPEEGRAPRREAEQPPRDASPQVEHDRGQGAERPPRRRRRRGG